MDALASSLDLPGLLHPAVGWHWWPSQVNGSCLTGLPSSICSCRLLASSCRRKCAGTSCTGLLFPTAFLEILHSQGNVGAHPVGAALMLSCTCRCSIFGLMLTSADIAQPFHAHVRIHGPPTPSCHERRQPFVQSAAHHPQHRCACLEELNSALTDMSAGHWFTRHDFVVLPVTAGLSGQMQAILSWQPFLLSRLAEVAFTLQKNQQWASVKTVQIVQPGRQWANRCVPATSFLC